MIRGALIASVLTIAAPATAEPCQDLENAALALARNMDKVGALAVDSVVHCMFHGPDDKAVDKLSAAARKGFAASMSHPTAGASCIKGGDPVTMFRALGNASGLRMGLAWSLCSTKARARITEMVKNGAKQADIEADVGKMAATWIEGVLK